MAAADLYVLKRIDLKEEVGGEEEGEIGGTLDGKKKYVRSYYLFWLLHHQQQQRDSKVIPLFSNANY